MAILIAQLNRFKLFSFVTLILLLLQLYVFLLSPYRIFSSRPVANYSETAESLYGKELELNVAVFNRSHKSGIYEDVGRSSRVTMATELINEVAGFTDDLGSNASITDLFRATDHMRDGKDGGKLVHPLNERDGSIKFESILNLTHDTSPKRRLGDESFQDIHDHSRHWQNLAATATVSENQQRVKINGDLHSSSQEESYGNKMNHLRSKEDVSDDSVRSGRTSYTDDVTGDTGKKDERPAEGIQEFCNQRYQNSSVASKLVVFWTPFWHTWKDWKFMEEFSKLREHRCSFWRCEFEWTEKGSIERVREADAVVFFGLDLYTRPLPPRKPHQLWIWLELEAPPISEVATGPWTTAEKNGIYFNMTMSYHHLNDIVTLISALKPLGTLAECPLTTENHLDVSSVTYRKYVEHLRKYDEVMNMEGSVWNQKILSQREGIKSSGRNPQKENSDMKNLVKDGKSIGSSSSNKKLLRELQRTLESSTVDLHSMAQKSNDSAGDVPIKVIFPFKMQEVKWALRPKIAVWVASNCQTDSMRENLVAALQRHVRVTTVGKCGELKCGKNHLDSFCFRWLGGSHLFYLSLENALCEDYYSEKLWTPMKHNMVPIVSGGAKYNKILPPGSYINAQSYPDILALAKHLVYLSNNPVSYLRYLQWRHYWEINDPLPWTCNLCSTLHKAAGFKEKRVTLDRWWNDTAVCYDPLFS